MGKITKIEVQKRNKDRVNVYVDNNYAFSVNNELVYKEGLKVNLEVDEEKILSIAKEENKLKCKETALRIIERSYKTEKEMEERLIEKGYDLESIDIVIKFLKEYNFIDDQLYAKMFIKDKIKSQGSQKIKYSLIRKGIDRDIIDNLLLDIDKDEEREVLKELAIKKYNQLIKRESDKYKLRDKLCRFLISRGYDYSTVKDIIREVLEEIK